MLNMDIPKMFNPLIADGYVKTSDLLMTSDGFFMVYKSMSDILLERGIRDFLDSEGERLACDRFFDDWFLYAVPNDKGHIYSLLKMREQEHDMEDGLPADGDTPGVTISFIAFQCEVLLACLADPHDENRKKLNTEINRVVSYRGQHHHKALKRYFKDPRAQASYMVAERYARHISSFAENGRLEVPQAYKAIVQQSISYKNSAKLARLPRFIEKLNQRAGKIICDNEHIFIEMPCAPTVYEAAAILATHTGNTSVYSFAAEVEYHARFLTPWAKIRLPFFGRSIYASAIRADMTVDDTEFEGPAPFYQANSKIVKRQYALHQDQYAITQEAEIIEHNYGAKLISCEYDAPIENSFDLFK